MIAGRREGNTAVNSEKSQLTLSWDRRRPLVSHDKRRRPLTTRSERALPRLSLGAFITNSPGEGAGRPGRTGIASQPATASAAGRSAPRAPGASTVEERRSTTRSDVHVNDPTPTVTNSPSSGGSGLSDGEEAWLQIRRLRQQVLAARSAADSLIMSGTAITAYDPEGFPVDGTQPLEDVKEALWRVFERTCRMVPELPPGEVRA